MKPSSAKAKGREGQKVVISTMLQIAQAYGCSLHNDDFISRSSGSNGEDVILSPAAQIAYPLSIECKNIKGFAGKKYFEQAIANCGANRIPAAIIKVNRDKRLYAVIDAKDLFDLVLRAELGPSGR